VTSETQFSQPKPKKSDYRQAATPAPRPTRTFNAPDPTPFTPPAGQPAPKQSKGLPGSPRQTGLGNGNRPVPDKLYSSDLGGTQVTVNHTQPGHVRNDKETWADVQASYPRAEQVKVKHREGSYTLMKMTGNAPQPSASGVGGGRQGVLPATGTKASYAKGKAVAPRAEEETAPAPARAGKGQLALWDDKPAAPAPKQAAPAKKATPRAPRAKKATTPAAKKADPAPSKPSVSDSDWNKMLGDSVAEQKVRKAAATPAPAPSGPKNFRETTLKKNGKEHVIRTEHNGSQKELEAKHTAAVKSFLGAAYAPDVAEAEQRVTYAATSSSKTAMKSSLAQVKRKAAGYTHNNPDRDALKKKPANRAYGTKEQLSMFEGDGPDDPRKSHEYGIKK
jgi:hypothetical protein